MIDENYKYSIDELIERYPSLRSCQKEIEVAGVMMLQAFKNNKKILIAGNGGSASDANHIVGELAKGFKKARPIDSKLKDNLMMLDEELGKELASRLQKGVKAIALDNHSSLNSAFANDVKDGGDYIYAQQVNVYGEEGDIFLGISTSGNSKNVYLAALTAKAKGMVVIGLTGAGGGNLAKITNTCIEVCEKETFKIQELHLPIYHYLCLLIENELF